MLKGTVSAVEADNGFLVLLFREGHLLIGKEVQGGWDVPHAQTGQGFSVSLLLLGDPVLHDQLPANIRRIQVQYARALDYCRTDVFKRVNL